jgi:hypothetical protein
MSKDGPGEPNALPINDESLAGADPNVLMEIRLNHGRNLNPETFTTDIINGHVARLETGRLTLIPA